MLFSRKQLRLAMLSLALLGGAGCGSMHHSYSVSPLSFFLPGLVHREEPASAPADASEPETTRIASVR